MKYAVIGRQIHTMPYAVEVNDIASAKSAGEDRPSWVPMFVVDFDSREVKRMGIVDGEAVIVDGAFNADLGRLTETDELQEIVG